MHKPPVGVGGKAPDLLLSCNWELLLTQEMLLIRVLVEVWFVVVCLTPLRLSSHRC